MLVAQVATSTAHITDALSKRVGELAVEMEGKTLHTIGTIVQQLEQEIIAAASSTAVTAEVTTRTAVEGMRRDVQVQIEQNRPDALCESKAVHSKVDQVSEELRKLTAQLNQLKPAVSKLWVKCRIKCLRIFSSVYWHRMNVLTSCQNL